MRYFSKTIFQSGKSFNVHNPNGNAAAWPLALWVVKNSARSYLLFLKQYLVHRLDHGFNIAALLDAVVVYDAWEQKHIETASSRVVLMGVMPFTARANLIGVSISNMVD